MRTTQRNPRAQKTAAEKSRACPGIGAADVEAWSSREWKDGLQIDTLQDLDRLSVRTRNSTYEITVLEPSTGKVLVRGGQLFPDYTTVRLSGSSLGGTFLKRHGIYVGYQLELRHAKQTILTSEIQFIGRVRTAGPSRAPSDTQVIRQDVH